MSILRVGVIGAGDVAQAAHLPSLTSNPKVEVAAIADPDMISARSAAERFNIPKVVADYREIIDDPSIAAVDVCVPHYLHYQITMEALNEGKHVILEKPIAMNLDEADRMIGAAHELGLWLLVDLNQRYLPIHRKVKEFLDDGRLGTPFLVNAVITGNVLRLMNDPYSWKGTWDRAGGGAFFDTGTHVVDLLHYWFGKPTAVTAVLKRLITSQDNKADDNAVVTFEYDDGLVCNIVVSYTVEQEPWSEKKFIYGTNANVSMTNEAAVPLFLIQNGVSQVVEVEHRADWWPWSHDLTLRNFIDVILEGEEPLVTEEDARDALKTVLYAYNSAREGKRIEIP
jgi:predicted dehydrogenase